MNRGSCWPNGSYFRPNGLDVNHISCVHDAALDGTNDGGWILPSGDPCTILCSRSLRKVKSIDSFFVLHNMHMILESLESDSKRVFCDTKISSIACWEHIEPEITIHYNGIV